MHFQPSLRSHLLGATLLQFQQDLHSLLLGGRGAHSCASNQTFILFWGPHSCTSSQVFILFFRGGPLLHFQPGFHSFLLRGTPLHFEPGLDSLLVGCTLALPAMSLFSSSGSYTLALPAKLPFSSSRGVRSCTSRQVFILFFWGYTLVLSGFISLLYFEKFIELAGQH